MGRPCHTEGTEMTVFISLRLTRTRKFFLLIRL
jgi:hypothetical protein